jgi:hypothetical protein
MAGIINGSINLSMIPKDKIIKGKKGQYLPISITINNDPDQFGKQGPIIVAQSKEEREAKMERVFLGNIEVAWTDGVFPAKVPRDGQQTQAAAPQAAPADDLPF